MEPPQASPEVGNVEKTSGRRTSCVVRQRYQLCGQAKAALRFQRHTRLCRAARITSTVGEENHIRHQPQPYKQFSTSSHLSASFKCTTNFLKPDNFLTATLSAVLCDKRLSMSSTGSSVLDLCYLEVCSPVSACQTCLCTHWNLIRFWRNGTWQLYEEVCGCIRTSIWIFDNCVPSLAHLWPHRSFFVAWVIEDVHAVAVGSMSTLQVINQMLSVGRIHFCHIGFSLNGSQQIARQMDHNLVTGCLRGL